MLTVIVVVLAALALFLVAFVPVITDQVTSISQNAPDWVDALQKNRQIQNLDAQYHVLDKTKAYVSKGDFAGNLFGGVLGVGLAVLGALANAFIVVVLTLYFLSSLDKTKKAIYGLAPASRRDRVTARRPGPRGGRRLCLRRLHRGDVRGPDVADLPVRRRARAVRRGAGVRGGAARRDPDDRGDHRRPDRDRDRLRQDPKIGLACVIFYVIYQQRRTTSSTRG